MPGATDIRLDAAVEGEPERRETGDLAAFLVDVAVAGADRDPDVDPGPLSGEQLGGSRSRDRRPPAPSRSRRHGVRRREATHRREPPRLRPPAPRRSPVACGSSPAATTTARPATRLFPFGSKKSTPCEPATPFVERGVATATLSECAGVTAPSNGSFSSRITSSPRRSTTRTRGRSTRESVAPTATAPGAPAGPAIEPKAGPAAPSFPAGATTRVFSSRHPARPAPRGRQ